MTRISTVEAATTSGHCASKTVGTALLATLVVGTPMTVPAAETTTLEEIVVTAQFRTEKLQDTPIAITAISAETMEQRGQTNVQDIANQAPNVSLTRTNAAYGPSMAATIRGIGQYDFNPAMEPGVGIYVDDVYYSTLTGTLFDLLDLERAEILRGPQGTLAGKNSIGGAVKLYSKPPEGDGSGYVEVGYGEYNRVDVRATGDFALVPDKLMMRMSGVSKQRDGYVNVYDYGCKHPGQGIPARNNTSDCLLGTQGGVDYAGARASLLWAASDAVQVTLIGDYTHDNSSPPGMVLTYANNPNPNVSAYPGVAYDNRFVPGGEAYHNYADFHLPSTTFMLGTPGGPVPVPIAANTLQNRSEFQGWGASGTIDWTLSDSLSLKSVSAYREYSALWDTDGDYSPLQIGLGEDILDHEQFSQELRLSGDFGTTFDYTVGAYYFDQRTVYKTHQMILYAPIPLDFLGDDPIDADTKAAFVHGVWHITDSLNFTGGLRYTEESKEYTFTRRNRDGTLNPFLGVFDGQVGAYSGSRLDYRANVDYHFTPFFMTYLQVSTGFKGGGVGPRPLLPGQVQPFGPEELTAYESGFKSTLGGNVRLNGSVFYNEYTDIQLTLLSCPQFGGPGPCALPQNAGDATIKGAELELAAYVLGGLQVDIAGSYLQFDYTRINTQAGGPAGVQKGMITPYTPKTKGSLGVQYEFLLAGGASITPRVDVDYRSEFYTNAVNRPRNRIDSRTLANANLTWRSADAKTTAALEVTNLADKYYYNSSFDLVGAGAGVVTNNPAAPRMWAVRLKRTF